MAFFTPSLKTWTAAVLEIADIVGASGDSEQTTRAHRSLQYTFEYLNMGAGRNIRWNFALTENVTQAIVAPYGLAITASASQASASALPGHGILVDDLISGTGFLLGTRVTATGGSGFGFSPALTGITGSQSYNITASRDFYDVASDFRTMYSVRMLGAQRFLQPIHRRKIDRGIVDELTFSTPEAYDWSQIAAKGKLRLVPGPIAADVMLQRYYRRMTVASASSVGTALDIPQDYEPVVMAWAKWHFLVDKAEGRSQQGQTWMSLAQDGLKGMIAQQSSEPDETLAFSPTGADTYPWGDRSTRGLDWTYGY